MVPMGMRTDCRHYESRTYPSGDVVRKCRLDLAPEAPWACPAECAGYQRRMIDAGWQYGSLGSANDPPPPVPVAGDDIARLLEETEDIITGASLEVLAEQERLARRRFFRKNKKKKRR
jgi:hypothetical protein